MIYYDFLLNFYSEKLTISDINGFRHPRKDKNPGESSYYSEELTLISYELFYPEWWAFWKDLSVDADFS